MMKLDRWCPRTPLALWTALCLVACAPKPVRPADEGDDPFKDRRSDALAVGGRWIPSDEARRAGEAQHGTYESAPAWDPSLCGGGLLPGTRALGEHLVGAFGGAGRYEGYNCRQNTADRSRMSVHGTGRALDVYVPLDGGQADNGLGDPIAHWLIENATSVGVQLIIWDQTKWNISYSGRKDAPYGGGHPHHDHLHIELTSAGAAGRTPFFDDSAPPDGGTTPGGEAVDPACNDTCPYANDGECDDGSTGGAVYCEAGSDCSDCAPRAIPVDETGGGLPYAGLLLDGMAIPYDGLSNSTLAGTGMGSVEPYGDRVSYGGREMVRGTISHFGGPSDTGVSSTETGAITGERLRSLNDPLTPSASQLAARPEDFYYVAMRWRYAPAGSSWLRSARVLVVDPSSGRAAVLRPVDWGPNTRTARIIDVSPQTMVDLGVSTDRDVLVAWAPAGTPLGVVGAASSGGGVTPAPSDTGGTEGCEDTCRYAGDGECDDGGLGADYAVCALGTDCADCGPRTSSEPAAPEPTAPTGGSGLCTNTCAYAADGECDDGGPGAVYSVCELGTDCADCGARESGSGSGGASVGASCGSGADCSGALECRVGVSDPSLHCCVAAFDACASASDCCGYMDCVSGACACRSAGRACLAGGDCCSGVCSGGWCA